MYDRIKTLCKQCGISVNKLEQALGIAKGSLCKMNGSKPSVKRAQELAEFFSVSVDYLLGKNPDEVYDVDYPDPYEGFNCIGKYLKESRERQGLSIKDLSEETRISEKVLKEYENGEREVKSNLFKKILDCYSMTELDFRDEHNILDYVAKPGFDGDYNKSYSFDMAVAEDAAKDYPTVLMGCGSNRQIVIERDGNDDKLSELLKEAEDLPKEKLDILIGLVRSMK